MQPYLLSEADARTCIEGQENEWVWGQVLVEPLIEEPIWVELHG